MANESTFIQPEIIQTEFNDVADKLNDKLIAYANKVSSLEVRSNSINKLIASVESAIAAADPNNYTLLNRLNQKLASLTELFVTINEAIYKFEDLQTRVLKFISETNNTKHNSLAKAVTLLRDINESGNSLESLMRNMLKLEKGDGVQDNNQQDAVKFIMEKAQEQLAREGY